MVAGKQKRIKEELLELLENLPIKKVGKGLHELLVPPVLFCLDNKTKFEKWHKKYLEKKSQKLVN